MFVVCADVVCGMQRQEAAAHLDILVDKWRFTESVQDKFDDSECGVCGYMDECPPAPPFTPPVLAVPTRQPCLIETIVTVVTRHVIPFGRHTFICV